jgi:hypothetical protein
MGQPFAEALLLKAAAALETRTQQVLPAAVLLPPLSTCSSSIADSSAVVPVDVVSTPVGDLSCWSNSKSQSHSSSRRQWLSRLE